MVTLKIDYTDGSELIRECKNYQIAFDPYNKIESYMLIRGKENIIRKLGRYLLDVYTNNNVRPNRKKAIKMEQPEAEYLKAVFSTINFREKPFLIPLILQFLTNYEKFYGNNQSKSGYAQVQTN